MTLKNAVHVSREDVLSQGGEVRDQDLRRKGREDVTQCEVSAVLLCDIEVGVRERHALGKGILELFLNSILARSCNVL